MSKEENLKKEVEKQISIFDGESKIHKKLYRILRYTVYILTGAATILSSLALTVTEFQTWLNMAIVIVTASAGVVTSIEGLRKPAELWIHERNVYNQLKDLQRKLDYVAGTNGTIEDIDNYFDQLQQILGSSQEKWTKQVMTKNQTKLNG